MVKENPEGLEKKKGAQLTEKDFIKFYNKQIKDDPVKLNEIFSQDTLSVNMKKDLLKNLAKFKQKYPQFDLDNDEIEKKISIYDLRTSVAAPFLDFNKKRSELIDRINYDYSLSESEAKLVDKKTKELDDATLKRYISKAPERESFLKKIGLVNIERKTAGMTAFFKEILFRPNPSQLSEADSKILADIYNIDGTLKSFGDIDIVHDLFKLSFLTPEDKRHIVEKFMPSISLAEIENYKVFGSETASIVKSIEKDVRKKLYELDYVNDTNILAVAAALSRDEIFVSTATVFSENETKLELDKYVLDSDHFKEEVMSDVNKNINYKETKESRNSYPKGFEDFSKELEDLKNFGDISKFKEQNYLVLDLTRKVGVGGKSVQSSKMFLKIAGTGSDESFKVKLINSGFGKVDFALKETFEVTFQNFVGLFKRGIEIDNERFTIADSSLHTSTEIKDMVKSGEIQSELKTISQKADHRRMEMEEIHENTMILADEIHEIKNTKVSSVLPVTQDIERKKAELEDETDPIVRKQLESDIENAEKLRAERIKDFEQYYENAFLHNGESLVQLIGTKEGELEQMGGQDPALEQEIARLRTLLADSLAQIDPSYRLAKADEERYIELQEKIWKLDVLDEAQRNKFDLNYLREVLDDCDSEGKEFGFNKGVSFRTKKGPIYTVVNDVEAENKIVLYNVATNRADTILTDDQFEFFYEVFQEEGCKRLSGDISSKELFLEGLKNTSDDFSGYAFGEGDDKNKLTKENTENKIFYDYFYSKSTGQLVYVKRFSGSDQVEIQFGEFDDSYELKEDNSEIATYSEKEAEKLGKKKGDKKRKNTITLFNNTNRTVPLSWLLTWVKGEGATPFSDQDALDQEKEQDIGGGLKNSFLSGLRNAKSIPDLIAGLKLGIDDFGEYLKEGSDEHAAEFAKSFYGNILPEQVALDLQSKVENKQKERSDQYVTRLKQLDTPFAYKLLNKWISNKNSPEYLKEAAMLYVIQKYGYLNSKEQLPNQLGTYTWYKVMGGTVNGSHFMEMKEKYKNEDENGNFTEEALVFDLIQKQCKGKLPPKRRSRLHKEMPKHFEDGKNNEYEDGVREGKAAKNIGEINDMMRGELGSNVPDHLRGLLEEAFNKGGSMKDLNKFPFMMAFSGNAHKYDTYTLNKFKLFTTGGKLVPILNFINKRSDLQTLNDTILEVSKHIQENADRFGGGKFENIADRAGKLYDKIHVFPKDNRAHLSEVEAFYEDYGEELTKALYMLNTGETDGSSYLGDLIVMEKGENEVFAKYHSAMQGFGKGFFSWNDKDMIGEVLPGLGTTGMDEFKSAKQIFASSLQGFKNSEYATKYLEEFKNEIAAIRDRSYPEVDGRTETQIKEDLLKSKFKNLLGALVDDQSSNHQGLMQVLTGSTSEIAALGRSYGIDFGKVVNMTASKIIDDSPTNEYDSVFRGYARAVLGGVGERKVASITDVTVNKVEEVGKYLGEIKPANDDTYTRAA